MTDDTELIIKAIDDIDTQGRDLSSRDHAITVAFALPIVGLLALLCKELLLVEPAHAGTGGIITFVAYPSLLVLFYTMRIRLDALRVTLLLRRLRFLQLLPGRKDALAMIGTYTDGIPNQWNARWTALPSATEAVFAFGLIGTAIAGAVLLASKQSWATGARALSEIAAVTVVTVAVYVVALWGLMRFQQDMWQEYGVWRKAVTEGRAVDSGDLERRLSWSTRLYFQIDRWFGAAGMHQNLDHAIEGPAAGKPPPTQTGLQSPTATSQATCARFGSVLIDRAMNDEEAAAAEKEVVAADEAEQYGAHVRGQR